MKVVTWGIEEKIPVTRKPYCARLVICDQILTTQYFGHYESCNNDVYTEGKGFIKKLSNGETRERCGVGKIRASGASLNFFPRIYFTVYYYLS